jgi:hypothetical protein
MTKLDGKLESRLMARLSAAIYRFAQENHVPIAFSECAVKYSDNCIFVTLTITERSQAESEATP